MKTSNSVMQRAHIATRAKVEKLGGRHSDYFVACLKAAHADHKRDNEMVVTFELTSILTVSVVLVVFGLIIFVVCAILYKATMIYVLWAFITTMVSTLVPLCYGILKASTYKVTRRAANSLGCYGTVIYKA